MADEQVVGMNYFDHQFLRTGDFETAQKYHVDRLSQHNSLLHGVGIVEGLEVNPTEASDFSVEVNPGRAVDQAHREVVLRQTKDPRLEEPPLLRVETSTGFDETEKHITEGTLSIPLNQIPGSSEPVFITIRQEIKPTTPSTDPGITGNTRFVERAVIEASTKRPAGAQLLLAQINRNTNGSIVRPLVLTGRLQATARLADDSVTSAKIAAADGESDQETNTGTGIKTDHIQDRAVTSDKIANQAIQENHLSPSLLGSLNRLPQWVVLPFFPKPLGTATETPAFILDTNHAKSIGQAFGVMEIPIPAGARQITRLRIAGTENGGVITINLFRAGINDQSTTDLLPQDNRITGADFDRRFDINASLDGESQGLALHVHASANSDIWLVAAEFTFGDDT